MIKKIVIKVNIKGLIVFIITINGINNVISTSKIRKITAIRKNWREKGKRELVLGSNPHSNGDIFSRSIKVFLEIIVHTVIIIIEINIIIILLIQIIIYTSFSSSFDWKSNIIIYYIDNYLPHQ